MLLARGKTRRIHSKTHELVASRVYFCSSCTDTIHNLLWWWKFQLVYWWQSFCEKVQLRFVSNLSPPHFPTIDAMTDVHGSIFPLCTIGQDLRFPCIPVVESIMKLFLLWVPLRMHQAHLVVDLPDHLDLAQGSMYVLRIYWLQTVHFHSHCKLKELKANSWGCALANHLPAQHAQCKHTSIVIVSRGARLEAIMLVGKYETFISWSHI